jgi:hypothetical protein
LSTRARLLAEHAEVAEATFVALAEWLDDLDALVEDAEFIEHGESFLAFAASLRQAFDRLPEVVLGLHWDEGQRLLERTRWHRDIAALGRI